MSPRGVQRGHCALWSSVLLRASASFASSVSTTQHAACQLLTCSPTLSSRGFTRGGPRPGPRVPQQYWPHKWVQHALPQPPQWMCRGDTRPHQGPARQAVTSGHGRIVPASPQTAAAAAVTVAAVSRPVTVPCACQHAATHQRACPQTPCCGKRATSSCATSWAKEAAAVFIALTTRPALLRLLHAFGGVLPGVLDHAPVPCGGTPGKPFPAAAVPGSPARRS